MCNWFILPIFMEDIIYLVKIKIYFTFKFKCKDRITILLNPHKNNITNNLILKF